MIELRAVSKTYGDGATRAEALSRVDLHVAAGELVSIVGPSGSGKSTLLHLLATLETPTSGTVAIDGVATEALDDDALTDLRREKIGLVFQSFHLVATLDAEANVLLPVRIVRRDTPADRARARALLDEVGLTQRAHHKLHQLSGGEQQRVALARALMLAPRLLLADEPTGNLDRAARDAVLALLRATCARHGTTVVMVTHDPAAARIGDRLVTLRDGRIVADQRTARRPLASAS